MIVRYYTAFFWYAIFLLLAEAKPSYAQKIIFNHVKPPEGSSWGQTISAITQDKQGYMWFASSGSLHRYDGYQVTTYRHDPSNPASLGGTQLKNLYTDRKGYIWIGTYGSGLDRLDPVTGIFTHFRHQQNNATSLSNDSVTVILEDRSGTLWVGTNNGLNQMNPQTGKCIRYYHNPADPNSLSAGPLSALFEDRQGTLWIGTAKNTNFEGPIYGGLNRLDKTTNRFFRFQHDPANAQSLFDNRVTSIYEDSRGILWIGTSGYGLHSMNREKGLFERYIYDPAHPQKLSLPAPRNKNYIYEHITFITEDALGALWFGTFQKGIRRYDPVKKQMTHFEMDTLSGFAERSGIKAYTSREGVLWISTVDGSLYRVDPARKIIPFHSTGFSVVAIYKDTSGLLWLGNLNGGGLIQWDPNKGMIKQFLSDSLNPLTLSDNHVEAIYEDRQGILWIGTRNGLNRLDRKTGLFTRYVHRKSNANSLTGGHVHAIYMSRQGELWVGTQEGLNLMNRQNGTFTRFVNNVRDTASLSHNSVTSIREDQQGNLWIGTGGGINQLDRRTGKCRRYLYKTATVASLLEDASGIIWAATNNGLYRSNNAANTFSLFLEPSAGITATTISHIVEDHEKNIWGSMPGAIFKISRDRKQVSRYSKSNGIESHIAAYTVSKGIDGELFFGNATGYYAFTPNAFSKASQPPQIVIANFRLADQTVKPGKNSPLKVPLIQAKKIYLTYRKNTFSFDFVGIHYSNPDENRLLFKLENLDNEWRKAGAEKTAYYYNVPSGAYIFRVKAANNDGLWSEQTIEVIVDPPWWLSLWAFTLYALLLALGIWCIVSYRSRSLRYENKILEDKVTKRTSELKHQKEELQIALEDLRATQAQLIQKEKMASLGELTAGIAHEIQNPLNFINNFSEINAELIYELQQELKQGRIDAALDFAKDVKENEMKIAYHGKRADAIVKSMLQHSHINSGQRELVDINELAEEYLRLSYHGLRAKDKSFNATLKTDFDRTIEKVKLVPQDVGRVLLNLYNNAFYAVNEKKKNLNGTFEPIVFLGTKKVKNQIVITVKDNGSGIPQQVIEKIFQPFFTTKPTGEGPGLGLSLSYDIITKGHGGELKVKTEEGAWSEFTIILPQS